MEQHSGDIPELVARQIELNPHLLGEEREFRKFCDRLVRQIGNNSHTDRQQGIKQARQELEALSSGPTAKSKLALRFACSVVLDVVAQGWALSTGRKGVRIQTPSFEGETRDEIKRRIRAGHLLERDAQLRQPSVAEFIKSMEHRRLGPSGWVSVFSLMRNGRELAPKLAKAAAEADEAKRLDLLHSAVSPYLQLVEPDAICQHTGLKLTDIWRYFRHTWVSMYKTLPGRSMMVLIRDSAAPNHPVIGIAALGSSMAQQTLRDQWIGWDSDEFVKKLAERPTAKWSRWVHASVIRLIGNIYQRDLAADGLLTAAALRRPTEETIKCLQQEAVRAAADHHQFPDAADHKSSTNGNGSGAVDWQKQAVTSLFRSKRAKTLALLLGIKRHLQQVKNQKNSSAWLKAALDDTQGRHAIRQLVRLVKSEHVGVDMMDIIICGAIAPYNTLLGGKLVCLLLTSPEIVKFYDKRYGDKASIIASSMKGKAVIRSPNLVLLATTSLYTIGSSQYNRIRIPAEQVGGKPGHSLAYAELGMSKGYGSYHFSSASLDYLETFLPRGVDGRKVNSIFGEGVNPLMRKLRDGLAEVNFPADELLLHGNPRVVYGIPLAENFREVLLGVDAKAKYFLSPKNAEGHTDLLAEFWCKRWLVGRISRPGILEEVMKHTDSYPVTHGARVQLPESADI